MLVVAGAGRRCWACMVLSGKASGRLREGVGKGVGSGVERASGRAGKSREGDGKGVWLGVG